MKMRDFGKVGVIHSPSGGCGSRTGSHSQSPRSGIFLLKSIFNRTGRNFFTLHFLFISFFCNFAPKYE